MGRPKNPDAPERAPLVGVQITPELRAEIDEAIRARRKATGDNFNISRFVREAIEEKLKRDAVKRPTVKRSKVAPALGATGS